MSTKLAATDSVHQWRRHPASELHECTKCRLMAAPSLDGGMGLDYVAWHNHKTNVREWEPVPPQCPLPDHLKTYVANPYYHRRLARAKRSAEADK